MINERKTKMSTVVSNEAKHLPRRPVDPPGFTGEQLVTQSTNKVADAKKLKEQEDRIAWLEKKGAEDALKLKEKDKTITKWKGIAGAFGILSLAMSSTLALNITEWQKNAAAFAIWMFIYFILMFVYFIAKKVTNW